MNVSAKDLGTGKEQKITITSSTKLTDEEINRKVKEAEAYAAEDKAKKEAIETRNMAETMINQTERTLKDVEGKIPQSDVDTLNQAKEALRSALEANNPDDIKARMEELTNKSNEVYTRMYQQAGAQAGQDPNMGGYTDSNAGYSGGYTDPNAGGYTSDAGQGGSDNVVDADYTVVDEDK